MDIFKARRCTALLEDYRKEKSVHSANRLVFDGVPGYDVYNISHEFEDDGKHYIFGRVEKRDNELSHVRIFRKVSDFHYTADFPDMVFENFQDPFVTRIQGELIVGGVQISPDPLSRKIINWRTLFYKGKTIKELALFAGGPSHMKDIRLVELESGEIGIFSRPQGLLGGFGKIGFAIAPSLEEVTEEAILGAKIYDTHFCPEEWGGANHILPLSSGKLGILGHIAYRCEKGLLHYHAMAFVFDCETMTHTPVKIIATRSDVPSGTSKRPDLADVLFSGGLVAKANGRYNLYTGVSDCEACVLEIDNPFA